MGATGTAVEENPCAGPFEGSMWLIVVDAHTKWPEVIAMKSTTASNTIATLRSLFARYGIPPQVVSDNGPQFMSEEYTNSVKVMASGAP